MYTMADAAAIWQSTGATNPFFLSKEPVLDLQYFTKKFRFQYIERLT